MTAAARRRSAARTLLTAIGANPRRADLDTISVTGRYVEWGERLRAKSTDLFARSAQAQWEDIDTYWETLEAL